MYHYLWWEKKLDASWKSHLGLLFALGPHMTIGNHESWVAPHLQTPLVLYRINYRLLIKRYINRSSWYLFHSMCCKIREQPWYCLTNDHFGFKARLYLDNKACFNKVCFRSLFTSVGIQNIVLTLPFLIITEHVQTA